MRALPRVVAAAALTSGLLLTASPAMSADPPDEDPVRRLGSCAASGEPTDVLMVLDRSASLKDTDPENARVDAAEYFIERLEAFAEASGADLSVAIAGFDVDFEVTRDWADLTGAAGDEIIDHLESYRTAVTGWETDYWEAVQGARETLVRRASGDIHCQAWVWFSDGSYDLDVRETDAEERAYHSSKRYHDGELTSEDEVADAERDGIEDLCRSGGAADQLRVADIITLAVGLKAPGDDANFDLMQGVATGEDGVGGPACTDGADVAPGEFLLATQLDDLFFAFDEFASSRQRPIEHEDKLCPRDFGRHCDDFAHPFVLDDSISAVHILATADEGPKEVYLSRVGMKEPLRLVPSEPVKEGEVGDVAVSSRWLSDNSIEIDLLRGNARDWAGEWSLVFVDPDADQPGGLSRSRIHLSGDVVPAWAGDEPVEWEAGTTPEARFALERLGGGTVDATQFGDRAQLSAELVVRGADPVPIAADLSGGEILEPQPVDLTDVPIGPAVVRLTLDLTTQGARPGSRGTALEPQSVDVRVRIVPPPNYPQVAPTLDLGLIEKLETVTGSIPIVGPGCVWLAGDEEPTTLPQDVDRPSISSDADSQDSCVEVAEGDEGELPVSFEFDELGNGAATGQLNVMIAPIDADGEPIAVPVSYQLDMKRPRDTEKFLWVLILVTAAGILIPFLLLYLVKWIAARIPGSSLLVGRLAGTADADGRFVPAGGSFALDATAMESTFLSGNRRHVVLPGGGELTARIGLNPGAPGYVAARFSGRGAASSHAKASTKKLDGWLPTGVAGSWVVVLAGPEPGAAAELVVLTNERGDGLDQLLSDAQNRMPDVVATLRERMAGGEWAGTSTPPPDQSGGWGGPPTPPPPASGGDGSGGAGGWGGGGWGDPTRPAPPPTPGSSGGPGNTGGW